MTRLSPKESYDRIYRIRRAVQCSIQHKNLPKEDWTKPEEVRNEPFHLEYDEPRNLEAYNAMIPSVSSEGACIF